MTAKLVATEMSKRPSFMQRFGSQDGNGSPTLLRSAGNHFYTAIPLIWGRKSRKRLVLVRSEVLGQFANHIYCPLQVLPLGSGEFTASISNADISKTKKFFPDFLLLQWNLR